MEFEFIDTEQPEVIDQLVAGVRAHNFANMGNETSKPLTLVLRNEQRQIIAGLAGRTIYHNLLINVLWVDESLRGKGIGNQLMQQAEIQAKQRGCLAAQVDTLSFQAPEFYQKCGFEIVGEVPEFNGSPAHYFLHKQYR